jgi:hypothetical protein
MGQNPPIQPAPGHSGWKQQFVSALAGGVATLFLSLIALSFTSTLNAIFNGQIARMFGADVQINVSTDGKTKGTQLKIVASCSSTHPIAIGGTCTINGDGGHLMVLQNADTGGNRNSFSCTWNYLQIGNNNSLQMPTPRVTIPANGTATVSCARFPLVSSAPLVSSQ